jgi:hypothetical protein
VLLMTAALSVLFVVLVTAFFFMMM